jgi:hypothetical protein
MPLSGRGGEFSSLTCQVRRTEKQYSAAPLWRILPHSALSRCDPPMQSDPVSPSSSSQGSPTRSSHTAVVLTAVGLVILSVIWALRAPPSSPSDSVELVAVSLSPDKIPLVTGDEPLVELFTRPGCPVCHVIPGIPGANGQVGPPLILGITGRQRLKDPTYHGEARTVHEYIMESVLTPQRFVVSGYPEQTMPTWYGSKLSALALERIATYLEQQTDKN